MPSPPSYLALMPETIKITGLIDIEIELPTGAKMPFALNLTQTGATPQFEHAQTELKRNQELAGEVAEYIKAAGTKGRTRTEITEKFLGAIKSEVHRNAVLSLLPDLVFRWSRDPHYKTGKPTGAERVTYFYATEETQA